MEIGEARENSDRIYAVLGVILFTAAWQFAGKTGVAGPVLPALSDVAVTMFARENLPLLTRSAFYTWMAAFEGLLIGAGSAIFVAIVMRLVPPLRPGLDRLALIVNATPAIAIGPILIVLLSRSQTPAVLAGVQVFFLFYIAASSGLRSASPSLRQVVTAFGAGSWKQFLYLDLPSALPNLASGLKAAVSASFLGAILGEWFGAPRGLGLVILDSMQNFEIRLMWAAVTLAAGMSLMGFVLAVALERVILRRLAP
jgi:ABC-type nitrate/sulfonate/bicarbonate transport system permease component